MGKRGKFSEEELNFIKQNVQLKTVEQIAHYLDRNPKTVRKYIDNLDIAHKEMTPEEFDNVSRRNTLHKKEC